jgi:hypothetical protein
VNTEATQETFGPSSRASELREAFWKMKRSRIRISSARSTRAGSIGHPCERFIYYERTAGDLRTPHTEGLQAIFDLGNELETFVVHELEAMGLEVVQRQRDYFDRAYEIGARADVAIKARGWPRAITSEIKGLAAHVADGIETLDDIRNSHMAHVRRYYGQLQTYLHLDGTDAGLFIIFNKGSGALTFIDVPRDQPYIDELLAKAARIRDAVRANEPPARHEDEDCGRCPFQHVCLPNRTFGPGVQIVDSEEIEQLIQLRMELADAKRDYDAADRALKKLLPEAEELLVGDFAITGKWVEREGYTVAPTRYLTRKFTRIHNGGQH